MPPVGKSWHLPTILKHNGRDPTNYLHVVFLQRLSQEEENQVMSSLGEVDETFELDVPAPTPRSLVARSWIRDYWPSSEAILEIAKHAKVQEYDHYHTYDSFVFVDSGWEVGNVIAARWEGNDLNPEPTLHAARVPFNVANSLLTACDAIEGYTLVRALGSEVYQEAKVDLYEGRQPEGQRQPVEIQKSFDWPESFPRSLGIARDRPCLISLRALSSAGEEKIRSQVAGSEEESGGSPSNAIDIYHWSSSEVSRRAIYRIFAQIHKNSPESNRNIALFFVDDVLETADGDPQILAAIRDTPSLGTTYNREEMQTPEHLIVTTTPIAAESILPFWQSSKTWTKSGQGDDELEGLDNPTFREDIHNLELNPIDFREFKSCPVFFLQPFSTAEERKIRTLLADGVEGSLGSPFSYLNYVWPNDKQKHSIHDLRDFFESCDPFSPAYNPQSPGPDRMANYPDNFVAVDERCLDPEDPKVILASSLDFSYPDDRGWIYGLVEPSLAHINFIGLDVANQGPDECVNDPKKLWLSDLSEYRKNEWRADAAGEYNEDEDDWTVDIK